MHPTAHPLNDRASRLAQPALHLDTTSAGMATVTRDLGDWTQVASLTIEAAELATLGIRSLSPVRLSLTARTSWLRRPVAAPQAGVHRVEPTLPSPTWASSTDHVLGRRFRKEPLASLPWSYDLTRAGCDVAEAAGVDWDEMMFEIDESRIPNHQFLGFAAPVQLDVWDSIRSDLAAVEGAQRVPRFDGEKHRLLFQVEAEPTAPAEIGDLGRLYVLVPEEDLRSLRFDRTVACVQAS